MHKITDLLASLSTASLTAAMPPALRMAAVDKVRLALAPPLLASCLPAAVGTLVSVETVTPKSSPILWSSHHATVTCRRETTEAMQSATPLPANSARGVG